VAGYGPYGLQAAIAACHARARTAEETDWTQIVALYDALAQLTSSPVVELNRAVALGMAFGPAAGSSWWISLKDEPRSRVIISCPVSAGIFWPNSAVSGEARAEFARAAADDAECTRTGAVTNGKRRHCEKGLVTVAVECSQNHRRLLVHSAWDREVVRLSRGR
jgi:predicted RNA polymerase sigma factor